MRAWCSLIFSFALIFNVSAEAPMLHLSWENDWLTIQGSHFPGREIRIHYLESYCRVGSTDADWVTHTMVGHRTELISATPQRIQLRCAVNDGLIVDHDIRATDDEVTFEITARNPTDHLNEAQWAQPCIRLGDFAGAETDEPKCPDIKLSNAFLFIDGKLTPLPTKPWITEARYKPGQVWCPKDVPRTDVNPRPLSPLVPSNGLIGCFSRDQKWIVAVAFEPYQELFQGVAKCLHSDFRIGQVKPAETKKIRGKIYILPKDVPALMKRYEADFPEQQQTR